MEAITLLKFAALFSNQIYLSDTVIADHHLFVESYAGIRGSAELYELMCSLIREGILKALYRDKVVVRGEVVVDSDPTLRDIYLGWQRRDRDEWNSAPGFTTANKISDARLRLDYYEQTDQLLRNRGAVLHYNPDENKKAFRDLVRNQIDTSGSSLALAVEKLPPDFKERYYKAINDPWFTYAEVWRLIKPSDGQDILAAGYVGDSLTLHAHCNQFCLASVVKAKQSTTAKDTQLLSTFNLELRGQKRPYKEVRLP